MVLCPKNVWEPKVSPQYEEQSLRALRENLVARVQWLHEGVVEVHEVPVEVPEVQRDRVVRRLEAQERGDAVVRLVGGVLVM